MKALAFLVLDTAGRIVDSGSPADAPLLEDKVAKRNAAPLGALFHRLVPVAEIPAWQPIETAPRDGSVFILGWPGGRAPGFWCQSFGRFSALPGNAELPPGKMQGFYPFDEWTHWQPLPAPPKEAPDAKS